MHRLIALLSLLLTAAPLAFAQETPSARGMSFSQSVYAELGGTGVYYSLNYEAVLANRFALRAGAGVVQPGVDYAVGHFPLSLSFLFGAHDFFAAEGRWEVGVSYTPVTQRVESNESTPVRPFGLVGYRATWSNGAFARLIVAPAQFETNADIGTETIVLPLPGLSFGYSF